MASAWGTSWGSAWGNSWGSVIVPGSETTQSGGHGYGGGGGGGGGDTSRSRRTRRIQAEALRLEALRNDDAAVMKAIKAFLEERHGQ